MATTFIGQARSSGGGATTVAIPAHQPGDLMIVFASGTDVVPVPAGWTSIPAYSGGFIVIGYKFATSTSDTSGTWANGYILNSYVYRQGADAGAPTVAFNNGTGTAVNFPDLDRNSAYLRICSGASSGSPAGWTARTNANHLSFDALAADGKTAAEVGGNTMSIPLGSWSAWTVGIAPKPAGGASSCSCRRAPGAVI